MNIDQTQRKDIDELQDDHVSLSIDDYNRLESPYLLDMTGGRVEGNNWIRAGNNVMKYNLADDDNVRFQLWQNVLEYKNITCISIGFDVECGRDGIILESIGLSDTIVTYYNNCETMLDNQSHVDVVCGLFGLNSEDMNNLINGELFYIDLNFHNDNLNTNLILSNMIMSIVFDEKLQKEIDVIQNRIRHNDDGISDDIDLTEYMKKSDYTNDLRNQTNDSQFLRALDNIVRNITGRGDDF